MENKNCKNKLYTVCNFTQVFLSNFVKIKTFIKQITYRLLIFLKFQLR